MSETISSYPRHAITLDDRRASRSTGHRFIAGGDPGLL
jgi:hypothetical protein